MGRQTWFITGASSGFGAALAGAALRSGHRVAVTARDRSRLAALEEAHPKDVLALSMDLTKAAEIRAAVADAEAWGGGIDVLINNAAIGYLAAIEEGEEEKIRLLFETNFFGLAATIRAALPGMRSKGRGTVVNISSTNGIVSMPGLGYYSSTKFAVEALTESLSQEVASFGIKVTAVEPGGFRTGIVQRNLRSPGIEAYASSAHTLIELLTNDKEGSFAPGDPDRMADILVRLVDAGDMPQRLIMGADSWSTIMAKLDAQRSEYDAWYEVAHSTQFQPLDPN